MDGGCGSEGNQYMTMVCCVCVCVRACVCKHDCVCVGLVHEGFSAKFLGRCSPLATSKHVFCLSWE